MENQIPYHLFFHIRTFTCFLMLSLCGQLWAHGADEPQHGGQVMMSGDVTFELVNRKNGVELFLLDDGIEMNTQGQTAKIKVKDASPARFIEMVSGNANRFHAEGVSFEKGTRILVLITKADGYSKIGANFVIE